MAANEGDADYATLDNAEMLEGVKFEHAIKSSAFEDSTNLFIPYHRQAGMRLMGETWLKNGDVRTILPGTPYGDITAALDYYFENCNGGRPFIIAGHSRGSAILSLVLKGYFKEHPEYYKRMVAAYAVGYSITKDDLEANPHMKFATGETFSKTMRKMWVQFAKTGNSSLTAEQSPDGKAKDWSLYDLENKEVMVLDEFDIHPAKESEVKIVDWNRSYFLTKYYML